MSDREAPPIVRGRPEASAAIWRWQDVAEDRAVKASAARRGGVIRALVAAVVAGLFFWLHRPVVSAVAGSVGTLTLILALLSPLGAYAALERVVGKAGDLVGAVLAGLLLTPVYYFFFAPFGLLFRRGRRDRMKRALERDATTYWEKREGDRPLDRPY